MPTPIPSLEPLDRYFLSLAQMVAQTSWLPHRETVKALGRAVFPTVRARSEHKRYTPVLENGKQVGMYDDNYTPAHALLWAHGIRGGKRKGWCFAHVWHASDEMASYTHLANLALIPECFASMTDKDGPLTGCLRWHAWDVYGWKPERKPEPTKPDGYDKIQWRYLERVADPKALIRERLMTSNNQRTRILRPIMESSQLL